MLNNMKSIRLLFIYVSSINLKDIAFLV